jgi:putative colanic acid biosynthesis UDP-glucose lipid carrier transferase
MKSRPQPPEYAPWQAALLATTDLSILALAGLAALHLTHVGLTTLAAHSDVVLALVFTATVALLMYERLGLYRTSFSALSRDQLYAAFAAALLATIPPLVILSVLPALAPFRGTLSIAALVSALGLPAARFALHEICTRFSPPAPRRIAIVGTSERVDALPSQMSLTANDALLRLPLAHFDRDVEGVTADEDVAALQWLRNAIAWKCDTLIVTEALPAAMMPAILRLTEGNGIKLAFAPLRLRPHACDFSVRRDGGVALLYPRSLAICSPSANAMRRTLDLVLVLPALIVLAPVMALIAAAIAIDSGAPVIFRQTRVGRSGREFSMLKFRTMHVDAEKQTGPVWAKSGQSGVTRVGRLLRRTSLDELPQFFNVLFGEMSIVGPRPERPFYTERFRALLPRYGERHLVAPGITGWAQINMMRALQPTAVSEKLSYDLFYLEHWSIFLDVTILVKTAFEFLFQRPV